VNEGTIQCDGLPGTGGEGAGSDGGGGGGLIAMHCDKLIGTGTTTVAGGAGGGGGAPGFAGGTGSVIIFEARSHEREPSSRL